MDANKRFTVLRGMRKMIYYILLWMQLRNSSSMHYENIINMISTIILILMVFTSNDRMPHSNMYMQKEI